MTLHEFSHWLGNTPLSNTIKDVSWIIPAVQSVHILAIAAVMSSVLLLDLRLAGVVGREDSISQFSRRYLSWIWWGLLVLLCTGSVLVIGEPSRSIVNPVFQAKMSLLLVVIAITLVFQWPLLRDLLYWESHARRVQVRVLGWVSLAVWVCIVVCGRWIAYATG